jgi:ribosomal protein L15
MTPVNLDRVQQAIDEGMIDPNIPITMKTLRDAKVVGKVEDGVKLLAGVVPHNRQAFDALGKGKACPTYYDIRLPCIQRGYPGH